MVFYGYPFFSDRGGNLFLIHRGVHSLPSSPPPRPCVPPPHSNTLSALGNWETMNRKKPVVQEAWWTKGRPFPFWYQFMWGLKDLDFSDTMFKFEKELYPSPNNAFVTPAGMVEVCSWRESRLPLHAHQRGGRGDGLHARLERASTHGGLDFLKPAQIVPKSELRWKWFTHFCIFRRFGARVNAPGTKTAKRTGSSQVEKMIFFAKKKILLVIITKVWPWVCPFLRAWLLQLGRRELRHGESSSLCQHRIHNTLSSYFAGLHPRLLPHLLEDEAVRRPLLPPIPRDPQQQNDGRVLPEVGGQNARWDTQERNRNIKTLLLCFQTSAGLETSRQSWTILAGVRGFHPEILWQKGEQKRGEGRVQNS